MDYIMVMSKVNVFEVKAKLSEYLARVAQGERIVIYRHNTPVAELGPVQVVRTEPRPIGPLPGRPTFEVPASFFEPLPDDELDRWEGKGTDSASVMWPTKVAEEKAQYGAPPRDDRRARGRRRS
jgi:prevent-host-death family protein